MTAGVVALCLAVGMIDNGDPSKWFGEGKPGTLLPVGLLLLSGLVCLKLERGTSRAVTAHCRRVTGRPSWRWGWGLLGAALILAGLDDMFRLHENFDLWIHARAGVEPTPLTDHLDDLLVLGYAVPAAAAAVLLRRFLVRSSATLKSWTIAAACFGTMAVLDITEAHAALEEIAKSAAAACLFIGVAAAEHRFLRLPDFNLFAGPATTAA